MLDSMLTGDDCSIFFGGPADRWPVWAQRHADKYLIVDDRIWFRTVGEPLYQVRLGRVSIAHVNHPSNDQTRLFTHDQRDEAYRFAEQTRSNTCQQRQTECVIALVEGTAVSHA